MEEIKVGEYIRTKLGDIKQITEGFEFIIQRHNESSNKIVKHSFDIKELVQAGDLIKIPEGIFEVIYDKSYEKLGILVPNKTCLSIKHSALQYIFSEYKNVEILTKEQFNQMKYIVGDESNG